MEFLYKIYSNQYFALGLFAVIAVLLVLFIIVLIAAIKDTKKRRVDALDDMENNDIAKLESNITLNNQNSVVSEEVRVDTDALVKDEEVKSLDFFASEEEQSKTRDITFDSPVNENSMNSLLDEFKDEEPQTIEAEKPKSLDELIAEVENNSKPKEVEPQTESTIDFINLPDLEVKEPAPSDHIDFTSLEEASKKDINIKQDQFSSVFVNEEVKEDEDEFDLPAMKKEETKEESKSEDENTTLKSHGIDLEKTGVLNFSNIESESYEIK